MRLIIPIEVHLFGTYIDMFYIVDFQLGFSLIYFSYLLVFLAEQKLPDFGGFVTKFTQLLYFAKLSSWNTSYKAKASLLCSFIQLIH